MSAPHSHPRRRPLKATNPQAASLSTHSMQLRKSGTFSSPNTLSSDLCGLDNYLFMPKRSPTSTEQLESLVHDAGVQRVANLLKAFDKTLAGHATHSEPSILSDPEVLPVPSFLLHNASLDHTPMDIDPKPFSAEVNPHDHASDSGLGSSLSGSNHGDDCPTRQSISTSLSSTHSSAVTRSFSALGSSDEGHTLGEYASKQIHDLIIKPILAEEELKDFHPLIKDVPRRIGEKNITNLRDLEKTLIFLAPEYSASPNSYFRFCRRSIELLIATVDTLPEIDRCLSSDRPYTNGYFLDLVEQIRRYAAIMAATREKEANGEELDEMDYSPNEKLTLSGGLTENGKPAQLVRVKDGKSIPLGDEADSPLHSSKRALSEEETDDDGARRSMARRRKSDKPGDVMHVCRDCKKEFKRPCDLTKHEKTHSRPWKCPEDKCKYFELGWPTEKERDRHVNDKHSAAPPQFKCLYPPCTYASKRESNCKQHMEKAHGWEYVRSKNNGRKKPSIGNNNSPPTPLTPYMGTPMSSSLATPMTPFIPSPSVPMVADFDMGYTHFGNPPANFTTLQDEYRRGSVATTGSPFTYSSGPSPVEQPSFEDAVSPHMGTFNHNVLDCNFNNFNSVAFQQPTPALSTGYDAVDPLDFGFQVPGAGDAAIPHLSPGARPDVTLVPSQLRMEDEGFGEGLYDRPMGDFTLFDPSPSLPAGMNSNAELFPDLSRFEGQLDVQYDANLDFNVMMGFGSNH